MDTRNYGFYFIRSLLVTPEVELRKKGSEVDPGNDLLSFMYDGSWTCSCWIDEFWKINAECPRR